MPINLSLLWPQRALSIFIMATDAEKWNQLPSLSAKLPWHTQSFEHKLKTPFRKLLQEWSRVPQQEVISHICRVVSYLV